MFTINNLKKIILAFGKLMVHDCLKSTHETAKMIDQKIEPSLLNVDGVSRATTLSRASIYRRLKEDETFPRPRKISGTRRSVWLRAEIDNWLLANLEAA